MTPELGPRRPRVLVDALNVAYWCGQPPSLRIPLGLLIALRAQACDALLVFDASAQYRVPEEAEVYAALVARPDLCLEVPSGRRADGVMLRDARRSDARIVSRDRFRDDRQRYRRLIDDPERVFGGHVHGDRILVPTLALDAPLPASAAAAWTALTREP